MRADYVVMPIVLSIAGCGDTAGSGSPRGAAGGRGGGLPSVGGAGAAAGAAAGGDAGDAGALAAGAGAPVAGAGGAAGAHAGDAGALVAGAGAAAGAANDACAALLAEGPPLLVRTVDESGRAVAVARVVWQAEPADAFWLDPASASCVSGDPPCSEWGIDAVLPERVAVSAERTTEAEPTAACLAYASTFAIVHAAPSGERQLLELTLPTDGTYCIDTTSGQSVVNVEHDEAIGVKDCLVSPPPITGPIQLVVRDQDGAPVPASIANWYYPPDGPDYDGEHPLACADIRCERWVVRETPRAGTIYLNASYAGPLNPFVQQGWSSYDGAPFEVEVDSSGAIVPFVAELIVDTLLESAIGG